MSQQIRTVHALASLRHPDVSPSHIQVVLSPYPGHPKGHEEAGGPSMASEDGPKELADVCDWAAQVRLGGREWLSLSGRGVSPGAALAHLLRQLLEAHEGIDARRAALLERARVVLEEAERDLTPRAAFDVPLHSR